MRKLLLIPALILLAISFAPTAASAAPGASEKTVEALLELRHPRGLNRFVRAVSDPSSPRYRRYSTVEKLVARFGPKKRDKKRVLAWLAERGLKGTVSPIGTYVAVELPGRDAAELLPRVGASASGADGGGRQIPAALRGVVRRISLVSARPVATHRGDGADGAAGASAAKKPYTSILPHSGTAAGCPAGSSGGIGPGFEPFTPNQYLTAYGHAAMHARGLKGQGQTVAVVEVDGFRHSDIVTFGKCFGVEPPPIRVVPVGIKKPLPAEDETTLDLEMLTVGAPGLDRILVYEGLESGGDIFLTTATALGDSRHRPDVISISLGFCEPEIGGSLVLRNAFDDVFAVAAGAGISVLVSSGDQGSSGCRVKNRETGETTAAPVTAVSLPASSPYATAVGGTNLALSKKNRIKEELVWNDAVVQAAGGGGGGSIISPRTPWWQIGVGYGPGRKVPDIAALADIYPGYAFYCTGKPCLEFPQKVPGWSSIGGTSAAAPLMASGIALANQYAERRGQPRLGFLNPLLYRLGARKKTRGSVFNDVVKGHNDIGRALPPQAGGGVPLGCCHAKVGYDWASGWGSLKVPGLARAAAGAAG